MGLFDDPLSYLLDRQQFAQPEEQKQQIGQTYSPQEQDSVLSRLVQGGGTALGYVGGTLDKLFGGRAIRQIASGVTGGDFNPRELLSVIPGSDTLGITNEADRMTGEKLGQHWGLTDGPGTKGEFEMRDLVGPALDIAMDPGTYLTFGAKALTRAGEAAKKLGAVPGSMAGRIRGFSGVEDVAKTIGRSVPETQSIASGIGLNLDDIIGKPLGGVAGARVPFLTDTLPIGTGETGQKIADTIGGIGDKLAYSAPGRYASAALDPRVHGALDAGVQRAWRAESAAERARAITGKSTAFDVAEPLLRDKSLAGESAGDGVLRGLIEGTNPDLGRFTPEQQAALGKSAGLATNWTADRLSREQAAGLAVDPLKSMFGTQYAPRSPSPVADAVGVYRGLPREQEFNQLFAGVGHGIRRDPLFDLPGGTAQVQRLVKNPQIAGSARPLDDAGVSNFLAQEFQPNPQRLTQLAQIPGSAEALADNPHLADVVRGIGADAAGPGGRTILPQEADELNQLAQRSFLMSRWPKYLKSIGEDRIGGPGLFGNDVISDTLRSTEASNRAISRANVAIDTLSRSAVAEQMPGTVPLADVLKNLRLTDDVGGQRVLDSLQARGISADDIGKVFVPLDTANAVGKLIPKYTAPDVVSGPLGLYDKFNQLFKTMTTAPWLGKHTRDVTSSTAQNLLAGSPGALTFGTNTAASMRNAVPVAGLGGAIPEFAARGLSDADATMQLGKELFSQGATGRGFNMAREGIDAIAPATESFADRVPGILPKRSMGGVGLDYARSFLPEKLADLNPLAALGLSPGSESKFNPWSATAKGPVQAGREVGDLVDDLTRGPLFADLRRQGYSADAAGKATEAAHFNYGDLTDFEKNVMRRVFPFYTYSRKIIPQQLGMLATEPGGLARQAIRAGNEMRPDGGFLPPQLGGGLAIPMGNEEDGTQRYLTKLDLPWEQPWQVTAGGPNAGSRTLETMLGQLTPLLKGPIEFATGKQLYSGRDQSDLYSRTGIPWLDQIVMNTPFSRALTTAGTLTDDRKDPLAKLVNLGTGARINDVDVEKARANAALDLVGKLMKDDRNVRRFDNFSVRPEALGSLSPSEVETLRLYRTLEKNATDAAHRRQAAGQ